MARGRKAKDSETPFDDDTDDVETTTKTAPKARKSDSEESEDLGMEFEAFLKKEGIILETDEVPFVIPTGVNELDAILGGGFSSGVNQLVGAPGTGKSSLAAKVISNGEKLWGKRFLAFYIDTEHTMTKARLNELGVKNPRLYGEETTVEAVFKLIDMMIAFKEKNKITDTPSMIVWDSIASTPTEKGLVDENLNAITMQRAVILTALLPRYTGKLRKHNICLLGINQLRDKIEMGGPYNKPTNMLKFISDKNIPGGLALHHATLQMLRLSQGPVIKEDEFGFNGISIGCITAKNKLFTPNVKIENIVFRYDIGYDSIWSDYKLLKFYKKIDCGGGWVKLLSFPGTLKFRQKELPNVLRDNDEFRKCFEEEVKATIQEQVIDKYKSYRGGPAEISEDEELAISFGSDDSPEEVETETEEYDFASESESE